jgi:hypothetical protein
MFSQLCLDLIKVNTLTLPTPALLRMRASINPPLTMLLLLLLGSQEALGSFARGSDSARVN